MGLDALLKPQSSIALAWSADALKHFLHRQGRSLQQLGALIGAICCTIRRLVGSGGASGATLLACTARLASAERGARPRVELLKLVDEGLARLAGEQGSRLNGSLHKPP